MNNSDNKISVVTSEKSPLMINIGNWKTLAIIFVIAFALFWLGFWIVGSDSNRKCQERVHIEKHITLDSLKIKHMLEIATLKDSFEAVIYDSLFTLSVGIEFERKRFDLVIEDMIYKDSILIANEIPF